jgi:hypothetical protein
MENIKNTFIKKYSPTIGNTSLLVMVFFTIFIIPLFPFAIHKLLYNLSYTTIFFMAIFSVETKRRFIFWIAIIATIAIWIAAYLDLIYILEISYAASLIFFSIVVGKLIFEIVNSKIVNLRVIVEAINCYLLIGFIFCLFVTFLMMENPGSYNFPGSDMASVEDVSHVSEYLYYTFVTFTTLGYGDIVPQTPVARSLAILISITGQIYIAIIIALLVGKFASQQEP